MKNYLKKLGAIKLGLVYLMSFSLLIATPVMAEEINGTVNSGNNVPTGVEGMVIAAPTANIAAGTYTSNQTVTLTASGATICYTTDGTTTPSCASATACTTGTAYSSAISITSSATVKAISCYPNSKSSSVASFAYTLQCSTTSVANGTVGAYSGCAITCNSGYTLSGSSCVVYSSGGGGGGGGGTTVPPCSTVTYSDWNALCSGNLQYRNVLTQTPTGCYLTTQQEADRKKTCLTTPAATSTPLMTTTSPVGNLLENILAEAGILATEDTNQLLSHLGNGANNPLEQAGLVKYKLILELDKTISAEEKMTINDFIVYGTQTTQRLGAGERAAVINSYYQAYKKLPNSEAEWSDVIKIANGRWPVERSTAAENQAKTEFKRVYLRNAILTNNIDENAIMVIAYGLLPLQRNLNSEKTAIKSFKAIYGHAPTSALAWNIVRAIAYSGAKR